MDLGLVEGGFRVDVHGSGRIHKNIRVQNWGFYFLDPSRALDRSPLFRPLKASSSCSGLSGPIWKLVGFIGFSLGIWRGLLYVGLQ